MKTFKWGIIGPGSIANKFATAIAGMRGTEVAAVASRSLERGQNFAAKYGIKTVYGNYEELAHDESLDAVYIATPHTHHLEPALACMKSGRAVLVEKPITPNLEQTSRLVKASRKHNCFLMEAMWTRCLPSMQQGFKWIEQGKIGEVRMIKASFGFRAMVPPTHRLVNPELAGGGLLDVGIYPLAFTQGVLGHLPKEISAMAEIGKTGVDTQMVIAMKDGAGPLVMLDCAVHTNTEHRAEVFGSEGKIVFEPPFWCGTKVSLFNSKGEKKYSQDHKVNGYEYEAKEVMRAVRAGELESAMVPQAHSVELARTMDAIRAQVGVRYPFES